MAGWSKSPAGRGIVTSPNPGSVPSLASIMREQEDEHKQKTNSPQPSGSHQKKFCAQWNPQTSTKDSPSLSRRTDEERIHSGSSRMSKFTFNPSGEVRKSSKPYTKPRHADVTSPVTRDRPSSNARTRVVNVRKQSLKAFGYKDLVDWLKDPNHVYIGRNMTHYVPGAVGSKWKNPFKLGKGDTRETVTERYRQYIKTDTKLQSNGQTLLESLNELKDKTLGCWCHPELCHGHILVQLIEEHFG